jgi:hypothetical protein
MKRFSWLVTVLFVFFGAITTANASNTIASGQTLLPGQYIESNNGNFSFGIDSSLGKMSFHYKFVNPAWGTGARTPLFGTRAEGTLSVAGGDRLVMQGDGNLVLYSGSTAIWYSGRAGLPLYPGAYAVIEDYGDLVIYPPGGGQPVFTWPFAQVQSGRVLGQFDSIPGYSFGINFPKFGSQPSYFQLFNNTTYYLWKGMNANGATMQSDGNFVITNNGSSVWSTGTQGHPGAFVTITPVGFMVIDTFGQVVANVAYPFNVNAETGAAGPGETFSSITPPAPSQVIPIGNSWQCFIDGGTGVILCFAPG